MSSLASRHHDYQSFLASKRIAAEPRGFTVDDAAINPRLFRWQRDVVRWALRLGSAALFEDCGLGKTIQQLEWANQVCLRTGGNVLILTPLAVAPQTVREAAKFGIQSPCKVVGEQASVDRGISVCNYERLHKIDAASFAGIVLDESSILKNYTGKTKQKLVNSFRSMPFRLACTATPAPNDRMELGNHAEFLGIMPSNEMLARWFINDAKQCGHYRLRGHGKADFWRWVASWAVCIAKPSDLGHSDEGYTLPPLRIHEHVVTGETPEGFLFNVGNVSATGVHREKKSTLTQRVDVVAELANPGDEQWAIWCDTDYEADQLRRVIAGAVEVRGSHKDETKADRFTGFADGRYRSMITKADIGGFGLNWQHCHKTTWFAGYSYEKFYQAIRRMWRFGQVHPVDCHVVMSDAEQSIADTVKRKQGEHEEMQAEMAHAMKDFQIESLYGRCVLQPYKPTKKMEIPQWIAKKA